MLMEVPHQCYETSLWAIQGSSCCICIGVCRHLCNSVACWKYTHTHFCFLQSFQAINYINLVNCCNV